MEVIIEDQAAAIYRFMAGELRQFIEWFECLNAEKKRRTEQHKEVMAEAKSRGHTHHWKTVLYT